MQYLPSGNSKGSLDHSWPGKQPTSNNRTIHASLCFLVFYTRSHADSILPDTSDLYRISK